MKEKPVVNARKINKMRFISGIVICSLVIILTFVVLVLNLIGFYDYENPEAGAHTLRMFTTLSNIAAAVAASMCLPFQIDGLRRDRYNLPSWIVIVMYVGAVGTFLTFFVALTLISSVNGFTKTMFSKSNLFLHTINPILITTLFVVVVSDHRMILSVSFGVCQLLRILHNLSNKRVSKSIEEYYKKSPDFEFPKVRNAIALLAEMESKFYHEGDDVYIPTDIIQFLCDRYSASKVPVDILYDIYLESYLINIGKKNY